MDPFTRRQALEAGTGAGSLAGDHARGRVRRLRHGVYAEASLVEIASKSEASAHALRAEAALLRLTGEPVLSHESAALLHGLPTLGRHSEKAVQVLRERSTKGKGYVRYPGVIVRQGKIPAHHRTVCSGVPVTCVARTVVDIARTREFRAGVVVADAALRARLCTRAELSAALAECARWPGATKARKVLGFADPLSESPLESISRVAFAESGLPTPQLQAELLYDRVDFLWARANVIGEADGMSKYRTPVDLHREKERQEWLERMGYLVVRWTWREVFARPASVALLVERAIERRSTPSDGTWSGNS